MTEISKLIRDAPTDTYHPLRPAKWWSHSTSWDLGANPSAPRPPCNPNNEATKEWAAAQARRPVHRNRHACSMRRRTKTCSERALAFASRDTTQWPLRTTGLPLPGPEPPDVRENRAPPVRGRSSPWPSVPQSVPLHRASLLHVLGSHPLGVQTPMWCPLPIGRLPRVANHQQPPPDDGHQQRQGLQIHVPDQHVGHHPNPTFSTDVRGNTLEREPPPAQRSCPPACSAMVATGVEWMATSADAFGQRQREVEAPLEQHPEQRGFHPRQH